MKLSHLIAIAAIGLSAVVANMINIAQDVRYDRLKGNIQELNKLQQEQRLKAREQKAIQDELCGIVRRLGVRVGRLEESQMEPPSNQLLPTISKEAQ